MVPWGVQKPWLKQHHQHQPHQQQQQQQYQQHYINSKFNQYQQFQQQQQHFQQRYSGGAGFAAAGWHQPQRRPPPAIPSGFQVDPNARYIGTVSGYNKWRGFGFIEPAQAGLAPGDKLFVHWKALVSDDRFPSLVPGLQ
ncbi:unnamed protein product, partial [Polarella glacialis]